MKKSYITLFLVGVLLFPFLGRAQDQNRERPFIWVQQSDRDQILQKIIQQPWAKTFYDTYVERINNDIKSYKTNRDDFLKGIPLNWNDQTSGSYPTFERIRDFGGSSARDSILKYVQVGLDCGVMYYLTEEEAYAQVGADILYTFIMGLKGLEPSKNSSNGGWIYPDDHLREAREIGANLPILYDFIAPFLKNGGAAYDLTQEENVTFPLARSQEVFRTYANLAIHHGHTGSNWSVLEANSLVNNALALEYEQERDSLLNFYLVEGTDRQDALPVIAEEYTYEGSVYPETSQYSNGVAIRTTKMMVVLNNYMPDLNLGHTYDNIPLSLDRWNSLRYPNGEIVRFGDGKRKLEEPYESYESAYRLGRLDTVPKLRKKYGSLIRTAMENGDYQRGTLGKRKYGASEYWEPTNLLWYEEDIEGNPISPDFPRTDAMPHAGVFLQRNLSETDNPKDALMGFVGGAHYVHGHASGMDMELYGRGEVMGVDNGRGRYRTDLHENYSRLFAAHNTVIVNGASQGDGGWVNLGMNSVELFAMEPRPLVDPLSPNHSFSITNFRDDRGDSADADQQRTLALVRTSPTTGYYVDIFRSKSDLPDEYHDYVYHNIGDTLRFLNTDLDLEPDPERFQANAEAKWIQNKTYKNPGWHFFEDVQSSKTYADPVRAEFVLENLRGPKIYMGLDIPGFENRNYTKVMAPVTFEAPKPYDQKATPTLVVRQQGEAWTKPFVVVFEPFEGNPENRSVSSVEKLESNGVYQGLKITSEIAGNTLVQYVLTLDANDTYEDKDVDISFEGKFAIITLDGGQQLKEVYIGEGQLLKVGKIEVSLPTYSRSAYVDFTKDKITINGNASVNYLK